jgi:HEAT repeat protein
MESMVETIEILAEQLRSADEETRRLAVVGLSRYPVGGTKDYLFTALGDASWRVRKEAVDALLAAAISVEIIEEFVLLLASDNAGLRNSAVEALERLGIRAMPVLCRHVTDDDHDVRKFVMDILGSIGDAEAVPLLVHALMTLSPTSAPLRRRTSARSAMSRRFHIFCRPWGKTISGCVTPSSRR